jgi:hypothetical protein
MYEFFFSIFYDSNLVGGAFLKCPESSQVIQWKSLVKVESEKMKNVTFHSIALKYTPTQC